MDEDQISVDLTSIEFGSPAAERDEGLSAYFVENDAFRRVAERNKRILIGNRGVGKSAIFRELARRERGNPGVSVIELAPEDYSYDFFRDTMASEQEGSWAKQSAYAAAWKYLIYVEIMKAITKDGTKTTAKNSALGRVSRHVRDNYRGGQVDKLSALISYLKRLEGVKIGKLEAGIKARELQKLYKLEDLTPLLPDVQEVLRTHRVVILVDELDKGWDESEDAKAFVAGLFRACLAVNDLSSNARLYMSLRQELYENIPALYEDAQKVRDLTETISWDEAGLKRLMAERVRNSLGSGKGFDERSELAERSDDDVWSVVFAETLSYRQNKSFNYIVDRTLYRPREVIQFCTQSVERAVSTKSNAPIDYQTIAAAEYDYSLARAQDIAAEYRFQYPDLLVVFEGFRGNVFTLDRSDLELICTEIILQDRKAGSELEWLDGFEAETLIEVLWGIGFLKAQAVGGVKGQARSGSQYLGAYQVASLNLPTISRFQVHPMFRSWLAMKEPKGAR